MTKFIAILMAIPSLSWSQASNSRDPGGDLTAGYEALQPQAAMTSALLSSKDGKHKKKEALTPEQKVLEDLKDYVVPDLAANSPKLSDEETQKIIKGFARKSSLFARARLHFKYKQHVVVQNLREYDGEDPRVKTIDIRNSDGEVNKYVPLGDSIGKWEEKSEIIFIEDGGRKEKNSYGPMNSLRCIMVSPEDIQDLKDVLPFMVTTRDIDKYGIYYKGSAKIDDIDAYVFLVYPKQIDKDQRYFEGFVWVDKETLEVVQSHGKAVPDTHSGTENVSAVFTTYLNPVLGQYTHKYYRFPVMTLVEDVLEFEKAHGDCQEVPIKEKVEYTDYVEMGSNASLEVDEGPAQPQAPAPQQPKNQDKKPEKKP